jgi:uncharacterized protein (TIGR03000 family)
MGVALAEPSVVAAGGRLGSVFVPQTGPTPFSIQDVPPGNAYSLDYQSYLYTPGSGYVPFWYGSQPPLPSVGYASLRPLDGRNGLYAPSFQVRPDNRARLRLRLPAADAEVWVEGKKTSQKGSVRYFYSPPLSPGTYAYDVRVRWTNNGETAEETRTVRMQPNTSQEVDFTGVKSAKKASGGGT